jgi:dihydrofolate synthase/folylpolyglutamate synthase
MFRTYREALACLAAAVNYEHVGFGPARFDLGRMRAFDRACGSPHRGRRIIHVAGTKGKGSTAHFIEALLRAAGFRTGLYTSPHVSDVRERIRLDGRPISRARFTDVMNRMAPAIRRVGPSYFEILTEAALLAFEACDWIVLEAGLGGRLDATNIVRPSLCVITPISLDHTERLGTTIGRIAREKAGIVKPGVPVVAACDGEALAQLPRRTIRAGTVGVPPLGMAGAHQRINAGLALEAMRVLGLPIRARALSAVRLPARIQRFGGRPPFWVDACHNAASARALARVLADVRNRRRRLIFGAAAEKDVEAMLGALRPHVEELLVTRFRSPRAMTTAALASIAARQGYRRIFRFPRSRDALKYVLRHYSRRDLGVSAGSFYLAGEVIAGLRSYGREAAADP